MAICWKALRFLRKLPIISMQVWNDALVHSIEKIKEHTGEQFLIKLERSGWRIWLEKKYKILQIGPEGLAKPYQLA